MAIYFQKSRHNISILDNSTGDTLGFVCSQENDVPVYAELDGQRLVDLFSTSPTQVSTDPMKELILGSDTHHAGFGQEYMEDHKKYYQSFGMDLSVKGQAMAGWNSSTCTKPSTPSAPSITNSGFETDVSPTAGFGWTQAAGTWTRSAVQAQAGTYSWSEPGNANSKLTQAVTGYKPGVAYTFTVYVYTTGPNEKVRVNIGDGVGTTNGTAVGTSGSWVQATVTRTLDLVPTGMTLSIEVTAGTQSALYVDTAALSVTAITVGTTPQFGHATFNDKEYAAFGRCLAVMTAGTTFALVAYMPATITCLAPFQVSGTDYLFIAQGTSNTAYYMVAAETLTLCTSAVKTFQYFAYVHTTVDTFYGNDGVNTIRSTINPLNGGTAWSDQIVIGEASNSITSLSSKDGALLIDKEDMPYYLDSTGAVKNNLAPECASGISTHSGKNSTYWQGIYYRPTGDQALLASGKYTDGTTGNNDWVQPARFTSNNSEFVGQVEAVAGDEEYLYMASDNSTKAMIWKGRPEVIDGVTQQVWHPFHELTITGVETMWISNVVAKRLYISSTVASESLFYLPLPTKYGDITADSARTFKTDTYFTTSYQHGGFKSDLKQLIKVDATLGHTYDADIYFECWYKILGGSWVDLGDLKGTATNRTATLYRSTATTSPMFAFKFIVKTDDTSKTPILLDYKAKTLLFAEDKKLIYTKVRVGRGVSGKNGDSFSDKYELQKTCMNNMRAATNHITMTNLEGDTKYVRMLTLPESPQWAWRKPIRAENGEVIEWEYTLLLLEVNLS